MKLPKALLTTRGIVSFLSKRGERKSVYKPRYCSPNSPCPFIFIFCEDVLSILALYLSVADLSALNFRCGRTLRSLFREGGEEGMWRSVLKRDFPGRSPSGLCSSASSSTSYLYLHTRRLEQKFYQLSSTRELAARLNSFVTSRYSNRGDELVGCVFDLIKIKDPEIARCVSLRRACAMKTVVVKSGERFLEFRRGETTGRPLSFLPLDMSFDSIAPGPLDLPLTKKKNKGFIGYVLDMIELRPEHEHLRMSVCWALFKDLAVFEDKESMEAARESLGRPLFYATIKESRELPEPPILLVSGESEWPQRTGTTHHTDMMAKARISHARAVRRLSAVTAEENEADVKVVLASVLVKSRRPDDRAIEAM